jgi:hypothetical protein
MSRVIAIVACGLTLSACSSGLMQSMPSLQGIPSLPALPSFDSGSLFGPQPVILKVETIPAGAEATSSSGGGCRTPCSLLVKAKGDFVVNIALAGYEPQAVPVKVLPPEDPRFASEGSPRSARPDPDQVVAELKPVAPVRRTSTPRR